MIDRGGAGEAIGTSCCGCRTGCSAGGIGSRPRRWTGAVPHGDGPAEARGPGGPGGRGALRLPRRRGPAPRSCGWRRACGPSRGSREWRRRTTRRSAPMRHAVIWRRISGGTDSEPGSRFVERMLTVVATCRQQGRNVLDYLTSCFEAASERPSDPLPLAGDTTRDQSRLIPAIPPCEPLRPIASNCWDI